jgi:sporulation protein YlmC with PRC-barrel domain
MTMRIQSALALALGGIAVIAVGVALAAPQVDVNGNGVHVQVGATERMSSATQIVRVKDLVGLKVYNSSNESLGKIEDLAIDPTAGKIRYAVLSFGGILGIGNKFFAVPWQTLAIVPKGTTSSGTEKESYCVLDVTKETLKNAPGFAKDNWPNFADSSWRQTIEKFYGTRRASRGMQNPQR